MALAFYSLNISVTFPSNHDHLLHAPGVPLFMRFFLYVSILPRYTKSCWEFGKWYWVTRAMEKIQVNRLLRQKDCRNKEHQTAEKGKETMNRQEEFGLKLLRFQGRRWICFIRPGFRTGTLVIITCIQFLTDCTGFLRIDMIQGLNIFK